MRTVADKEANKDLTLLNMSWKKVEEPKLEELSEREMEAVTTVFRSFETGLREATIYPKVDFKSINGGSITFKYIWRDAKLLPRSD